MIETIRKTSAGFEIILQSIGRCPILIDHALSELQDLNLAIKISKALKGHHRLG
jgi:hypothetical protein